MSVVAVKVEKNRIVIGADSFVGFSYDSQLKDKDAKIFKHNGLVVGGVGYATDVSLFRLFTKTRQPSSSDEESIVAFLVEFIEWCRKKDTDYKLLSDFMVVFKNKAFLATSQLYVKRIKDYEAMGAGQNMAQTALYLGKDVKTAIESACELSIYCEKPINIIEVRNK